MNKLLVTILGLGALTIANALPTTAPILMSFVDIVDPNPDYKLSFTQGRYDYRIIHDVKDDGFDVLRNHVLSANLVLTLEDDIDVENEKVRIKFDNVLQIDQMEVDAGPYSFFVNSAFLQNDGKLVVDLRIKSGDFWFRKSELTVNTEVVPEPASIAMLGLGLLSLGFATRRKKK